MKCVNVGKLNPAHRQTERSNLNTHGHLKEKEILMARESALMVVYSSRAHISGKHAHLWFRGIISIQMTQVLFSQEVVMSFIAWE